MVDHERSLVDTAVVIKELPSVHGTLVQQRPLEAEERQGDPRLPPYRPHYDYVLPVQDVIAGPVGGRLSFFIFLLTRDNKRRVYSFSGRERLFDFSYERLPGCDETSYSHSQGCNDSRVNKGGNLLAFIVKSHRPNRRSGESLFIPHLCYPKEVRGSKSHFEFKENKCVSPSAAFSDGDFGSGPSPAFKSRLGSDHRSAIIIWTTGCWWRIRRFL